MAETLDTLIDGWLAEYWRVNPTLASSVGIDGYDDQLPDLSESAIREQDRRDDEWAARFSALDPASLSLDERLDRDLVLASLRGKAIMRDWESWKRDPSTYAGPFLGGVFTLFLNRLHPEPDLVRFAAARLRAAPDLLAAGRENLDPELASPLAVERAIGQCLGGVRYARDLIPGEVQDDKLRAQIAEAGAVAADALESFADHLRALAEKATGEWAIGEARYSQRLLDQEMLGYGAEGLHQRGQAAFDELDAQMAEVAKKVDTGATWRELIERLNQEHPPTPEAMRDAYDEWTAKCRQFLVERDLVTLPEGEECLVVPSPPFQRAILAVASYSRPPAFKPSMRGHFFVPFPPDGADDAEIQKRLETNSYGEIPTVSAHEAYPGHHWHLSWMQLNPRPIRRVLGTPYFSEGWGLYAERLMHEQGFFADPKHELYHLKDRIFRAARIIVDTSLHVGDMSFDEAVAFMQQNAGLSEPTAKAEVGRYCSWPTQAASYLTGSLEIERIRRDYLAAGKGDLRAFNDTIAGSGMLPIALAEAAVMQA